MIKSFTITNYVGDSIKLELTRPDKSGFVVKSITGLGPTKATINTTKTATHHGSLYNSAQLEQRNIVMNLEFYQGSVETIEEIRHKSYKYFPEGQSITILAEVDNRLAEITGYVESNEPDIFSKTEGCAISIICPDPFWYSKDTNTKVFSGVEPAFEFPFENNSLKEPLLELGLIMNKTEEVITYTGDAEVGITITIHALGEVSDIAIYNVTTREIMNINTNKIATLTGSGIVAGDTIIIKTQQGDRSIFLLRDGVNINILNSLDKGCKWFTLSKGDNRFAYTATTGSSNLQFSVTNKIVYNGV